MNEIPYEIIDGKIYPRKVFQPVGNSGEIAGDSWKTWKEGAKYFLDFDEGHFATKILTIEISEEQYNLISSRPDAVAAVILSSQKVKPTSQP